MHDEHAMLACSLTKCPVGYRRPELETYKYDMPGEDHVTQNELFLFDIETLEGTVIDEGEDAWTDQTYSIPTVRAVTRHSLRFLLVVRRSAEFRTAAIDLCVLPRKQASSHKLLSTASVSKMCCVAQEREFRYPADSDKPYIRKWLKPGSGEMYYIRTDRGRHRVSLMALVSQRSRLSMSTVTDLSQLGA